MCVCARVRACAGVSSANVCVCACECVRAGCWLGRGREAGGGGEERLRVAEVEAPALPRVTAWSQADHGLVTGRSRVDHGPNTGRPIGRAGPGAHSRQLPIAVTSPPTRPLIHDTSRDTETHGRRVCELVKVWHPTRPSPFELIAFTSLRIDHGHVPPRASFIWLLVLE